MCTQFGEKFFSTQEKITLIDLGREYQKSKEDLLEYIQRFRERVLDVQEAHEEKELVKVCIQGMFNEYRVHLENLSLSTFATLVEAARRTNNTVQRQKESNRYRRNTLAVHAVQTGGREDRSVKRPRRDFQRREIQIDDAPYFLIRVKRVRALLQEWIRDDQINLPYTSRPPTNQEKTDPKYCEYHRTLNHPFAECRNMKRLVHRRVQKGEIVIAAAGVQTNPLPAHRAQVNAIIHSIHDEPQLPQDEETRIAALVTSSKTSSLLKTPNVRHFFNLLGFSEDTRKEATETLVHVVDKYHGEGGMVDSKVKRWADTYRNAIVFTEADIYTIHPNHNKPFYVESIINGMPIRRILIDDGS